MLTVERSKRRIEAVTIPADFSDRMSAGDSILGVTITIEVFSGEDPSPADMLYLPPIIDTQAVAQRVKLGVVGNIYNVQFSVVTSAGDILDQTTRIAILPDANDAIPQYIPVYFTSWPYPVEVRDALQTGMTVLSSRIRPQVFFIPEGTHTWLQLPNSTLIVTLRLYTYSVEWTYTNLQLLDGTLIASLVSYTWPPGDAIATYLSLPAGTLIDHLVSYAIPNEGITISMSLAAGTLS